jgi:hypothetical protein
VESEPQLRISVCSHWTVPTFQHTHASPLTHTHSHTHCTHMNLQNLQIEEKRNGQLFFFIIPFCMRSQFLFSKSLLIFLKGREGKGGGISLLGSLAKGVGTHRHTQHERLVQHLAFIPARSSNCDMEWQQMIQRWMCRSQVLGSCHILHRCPFAFLLRLQQQKFNKD